jgi:hypothetical protein
MNKPAQPARPSWLAIFHPQLTMGLIFIVIVLALVAISSAFGVYDSIVNQNQAEIIQSGFRMLLYGIPAYGIMRMKKWARLFELLLSIFLVVLAGFLIIAYFSGTNENVLLIMGALILIIHGSIAKYLLSAKCKQAFGLAIKGK